MIEKARKFIARIVDTRVSEAVIDLHRSMQHLNINADERHKEVMARLTVLDDNSHNAPIAIRDAVANGVDHLRSVITENNAPAMAATKKPFVGRELKNEKLKSSKEWAAMTTPAREYFIAQVKDRFDDIEVQGCFEQEFFRSYVPVIAMLSQMQATVAKFAEDEVI